MDTLKALQELEVSSDITINVSKNEVYLNGDIKSEDLLAIVGLLGEGWLIKITKKIIINPIQPYTPTYPTYPIYPNPLDNPWTITCGTKLI